MTRPVGKSPARSRIRSSQLDLNQVSLIDVCAEDDSLLPGKVASPQGCSSLTPCSRPGASPFKASAIKTLACIQEDQPECGESQSVDKEAQDVLMPLSTEEPAVKKKKKKSGFNLRKSLAWNNAFFTEEGVLDPDELSLVNRTFRTPLEEPKPRSNKKPAFASKILNSSAISKINFSPVRFQKPGENRHRGTAPSQGSPLGNLGNACKRTDQLNNAMKGSAGSSKHTIGPALSRTKEDTLKHAKSVLPSRSDCQGLKPSPLKRQIEGNPRITSASTLPARTSSKPPLNQPKNTPSISSTFSSASRMMKDRLGMVFAGRSVVKLETGTRPAAEDDTVVPSPRIPEYSDSAKVTRCYSHSSYERFGSSTSAISTESTSSAAPESKACNLQGKFAAGKGIPSTYDALPDRCKGLAPSPLFSHSQRFSSYTRPPQQSALEATNASTRETGASEKEILLSRAKPSGLRMPSPKLGFFDKARTTNSANIAVLRERTNGLGYAGAAQLPTDVSKQSNSYGIMPQARYVGGTQPQTDVSKQNNIYNAIPQPRYAGVTQLPTEVSKESNSYGIIPQTMRNTSSQPANVSIQVNGLSKQASEVKPPLPSKNSGEPPLECSRELDGLPHISLASHLRSLESSSKPAIHVNGHSKQASMVKPSIPTKDSDEPQLEHSSEVDGLSHISVAPHLRPLESSTKLGALLTLPEGSEIGPSSVASMSSSSTHGSSSTNQAPSSTNYGPPSLSSDISGSRANGTGTVLKAKKNVQNVLPTVKKMVNKLNLSPLRITEQENCLLEHPQMTGASQCWSSGNEKACSKGDNGTTDTLEEWPQVKSGAVQNSPPYKEPPKYGPWSPVRRNAPELGPFDCTKYTNNTGVARIEQI